jgi:hypothetical protein
MRTPLLQGPLGVLGWVAMIGLGIYLVRNGRYQHWVERMFGASAPRPRSGYVAIPLLLVFFGFLGLITWVVGIVSGHW